MIKRVINFLIAIGKKGQERRERKEKKGRGWKGEAERRKKGRE